jgi:hypothetical protein
MATVYSTLNGKQRTASNGLEPSPPSGGSAVHLIGEILLATALPIGTIVDLVSIPPGCSWRVTQLNQGGAGAGVTCSVGTLALPADQIAAGTSIAAASVQFANAGYWRYNNTGAVQNVVLTTAGAVLAQATRMQLAVSVVRGNVAPNQP